MNDEQGTTVMSMMTRQEELDRLIAAFLIAKTSENKSLGTLDFYRKKLANFHKYCTSCGVTAVSQLTPNILREFLNSLRVHGNNDGGIHSHYRTIKTFLRWYEHEFEPDGWKNPINKVKNSPPKIEPLDPCNYEDVVEMMKKCGKNLNGKRDKAMMLVLLDTGCRASELLNIRLTEIDILSGEIFINKGKGGKSRFVYLGESARKAVRQYLKTRTDNSPFLWITDDGDHLTYWGLVDMLTRRASQAGVPKPSVHSFRYFFALTSLRNGMDVFSLQKAGGWASMAVMRRYLKQTEADVEAAMKKYSPVDNLK
jgi:integrase/recombinase XerD